MSPELKLNKRNVVTLALNDEPTAQVTSIELDFGVGLKEFSALYPSCSFINRLALQKIVVWLGIKLFLRLHQEVE